MAVCLLEATPINIATKDAIDKTYPIFATVGVFQPSNLRRAELAPDTQSDIFPDLEDASACQPCGGSGQVRVDGRQRVVNGVAETLQHQHRYDSNECQNQ